MGDGEGTAVYEAISGTSPNPFAPYGL